MTLALLAITQLFQPVGFVLSLVILLLGFFLPLSMHRIPHPAGWPNPQMVGALLAGVTLTTFNYFKRVFHVVWPDYYLSFIIMAIIGFTALVIYFKLRRSDPGFDKIGKLSSDGKPFTIVDVARQVETSPHGFAYMEGKDLCGDTLLFCTKCEIVIPEYTKHCKLCQGCCRGFDHHCTWLSSCIGYKNHRLFIIFVY
ncbi:probable palmitoyltransferase ZDHHC11B isoform X2 [Halichondria panicea]|uniref:probable palmitoyltransferase ZDHHC11B isoform X2 n=1 Tax=Halichondria panicea TaxID=6063 RepID=UPI00312B6432